MTAPVSAEEFPAVSESTQIITAITPIPGEVAGASRSFPGRWTNRAASVGMFVVLLTSPASTSYAEIVKPESQTSTSTGGYHVLPGRHRAQDASSQIGLTVSASVRRLRDRYGLTWDQLSKLFGVSRRAVHHWANGGRMAARHSELLGDLARTLGRLPGITMSERRDALLAPGSDGYSLYDQLRGRFKTSSMDVLAPAYTQQQILGEPDEE